MARKPNRFKTYSIIKFRAAFVDGEGVFMDNLRHTSREAAMLRCAELNDQEYDRTGETPWFPIQTKVTISQANQTYTL